LRLPRQSNQIAACLWCPSCSETSLVGGTWRCGAALCGHAIDAANPSGVAHVGTCGADSNNTTGRGNAATGLSSQGRVDGAGGVVDERMSTVGRVRAAGGVANERTATRGRVEVAGGVVKKASAPLAVLKLPLVFSKSAATPLAVF
jgi:hypothetical protein